MWAHLAEPRQLINMPGVHFMMTAVISRNDFSDGWRPVGARGIRSHVKRAPLGSLGNPRVSMATEPDASFYLEDEKRVAGEPPVRATSTDYA